MKRVQVLLSSFNGDKYIREQIDSILTQENVDVYLLVRDDGSKDNTVNILKEYSGNTEKVKFIEGENIGIKNSFFELLDMALLDMDYYAFSDQDDIWLPQKLYNAISLLENEKSRNIPMLYASNVIYADETLMNREESPYRNRREPTFGNALLENICVGCTQVFNRKLFNLVRGHKPKCEILHDWWLYLSASSFGKVIYDQNAYILYRQHSHNAVGMQKCWRERWSRRVKDFDKLKYSLSEHAVEFINQYGTDYHWYESAYLLATYRKSFIQRMKITISKKIYRQQSLDNLIFHMLFLLRLL